MHPFASPLFLLLALLLSATSFVRAEEDYETMGVLPQSFFEPESSLAKRAADLTQLDPRDTEAFYWSTNRNSESRKLVFAFISPRNEIYFWARS
jgi:hypothetical protein